ncbi:MAG: TonB family protein [Desulfuromonas sp.]|nr:TonB family protein [Desulfuromonas sp.]
MDESRHLTRAYPAMTRDDLPERRRLLKAAGCSLAVHVALFALAALWAGGGGWHPLPATIITVDLRGPDLPLERAEVPEKASAPPPARTVARPAAVPAASPARERGASPAPAADTLPARTVSPVGVVSSAEPVRGMPGESPATAPASALPAGPVTTSIAPSTTGATPFRGGGEYFALCRGLIEKNKNYPVMARKGRIEGTVIVSCVLARDGSIRQSGLVRTSGSTLLDNAALKAVRSVGQFPPVPPEVDGEELPLEVPISFRLSAR